MVYGKGPSSVTAGEWGNKNVKNLQGWVVVLEGKPLEDGDVVNIAKTNPEPGVTRHIAIYHQRENSPVPVGVNSGCRKRIRKAATDDLRVR